MMAVWLLRFNCPEFTKLEILLAVLFNFFKLPFFGKIYKCERIMEIDIWSPTTNIA